MTLWLNLPPLIYPGSDTALDLPPPICPASDTVAGPTSSNLPWFWHSTGPTSSYLPCFWHSGWTYLLPSTLVLTQPWTYLLIFALVLTQQRQVVQLLCNIWMVLPKHLNHKAHSAEITSILIQIAIITHNNLQQDHMDSICVLHLLSGIPGRVSFGCQTDCNLIFTQKAKHPSKETPYVNKSSACEHSYITTQMQRRCNAKYTKVPTFSLISRARLHRGSASLYLPLLPYSTAKLFSVAATWSTNNVSRF